MLFLVLPEIFHIFWLTPASWSSLLYLFLVCIYLCSFIMIFQLPSPHPQMASSNSNEWGFSEASLKLTWVGHVSSQTLETRNLRFKGEEKAIIKSLIPTKTLKKKSDTWCDLAQFSKYLLTVKWNGLSCVTDEYMPMFCRTPGTCVCTCKPAYP